MQLDNETRIFINFLRGASVFRVVLVHLGLSWFWLPYSKYVGIFFPILFFASGAVSFYSFNKSSSITHYTIRRLLSIYIPYLLFMGTAAILYQHDSTFSFTKDLFWWLLLIPNSQLFDFPIGHLWFIHVLLAMILVSLPLFMLNKKNNIIVFCFFTILLLFSSFVSFEDFHFKSGLIPSYLLYETLNLLSFFLLGALYVQHKKCIEQKVLLAIGVFVLLISLSFDIVNQTSLQIELSSIRPVTYIYQAYGVIFLLLGCKSILTSLILKIKAVKWWLLFCNTNAYSMFILHIPILYFVETIFGWHDLGGNIVFALFRLIMVVVITAFVSPLFTKIHKSFLERASKIIIRKDSYRQI